LTEHDDVITPLLRGAPRLDLALGPAPARAGPDSTYRCRSPTSIANCFDLTSLARIQTSKQECNAVVVSNVTGCL